MLDFQNTPEQFILRKQDAPHEIPASILEAVSKLSNQDLEELEDELDFFAFTGLKGRGIRCLLEHL